MSTLGLVGYGTVAGLALEAVAGRLERPLDRLVCCARAAGADRARGLVERHGVRLAREWVVVTTTEDLIAARPDVVVEAAGHEAIALTGEAVLAAGIELVVSSVGALADDVLRHRLETAARSGGGRLTLLPGAIGGLDILAAAKLSGLTEVTYVSRKPPAAWVGTPAEARVALASVAAPTPFYEGSARQAARDFPKNANVAATVALAGLGFEATRVRLVADPTVSGNVHEIAFRSAAADVTIRIEGRPSPDNPKTSATTGWSLARAILDRFGQEGL
ncbi:MAG: aspartate dehydrogenase [Siculibacillus sp.]|nr:aspartate dehydrogenase [Siculibacillus sp.]